MFKIVFLKVLQRNQFALFMVCEIDPEFCLMEKSSMMILCIRISALLCMQAAFGQIPLISIDVISL